MDHSDCIIQDYIILENSDLYNFVHKINSNDIINGNRSDLDDNSTYIIYFDLIEYIDDIKQTYRTENAIMIQFSKDYTRQHVILNGIHYGSQDNFLNSLTELLKKHKYMGCIRDERPSYLIPLFLCQSSFVFPYIILTSFYGLNDGERVLSSGSDNRIMKIDITDEKIIVELNATLNIFDTTNEKYTHKIDLTIAFDLEKNAPLDSKMGTLCHALRETNKGLNIFPKIREMI